MLVFNAGGRCGRLHLLAFAVLSSARAPRRLWRLWKPRRSQTSLNPPPPLVHRTFDFFIGTVDSNLAGANLDTYILDAIESRA